MDSPVLELLEDQGRITGVRLQSGEEIRAKLIIAR
jgi:hypothetical protein